MQDNDNDIQIADMEHYTGEKHHQYSHQELVMRTMRKCIEAGCREMRPGWFNRKVDVKGNISMVYMEDTRKQFVESVKSTEMIMECDMDDEARKEIKNIKGELKKKFLGLCVEEQNDWDTATVDVKRSRWRSGIQFKKGYLNTDLPYFQEYIDEEIEAYREIFKELNKLTERLDFYSEEEFEA